MHDMLVNSHQWGRIEPASHLGEPEALRIKDEKLANAMESKVRNF